MRRLLVATLLSSVLPASSDLLGAAGSSTPAHASSTSWMQDKEAKKAVTAAEKKLSIALRKRDELELARACVELRKIEHPLACAPLVEALGDLASAEEKVFKKLSPLEKQRARLDKQRASALKRAGKSAENTLEKLDREGIQIYRKSLPHNEELQQFARMRTSIVDGLSGLLTELDPDVKAAELANLAKEAERAKEPSKQLALFGAVAAVGEADATQALLTKITSKADEDFLVRCLLRLSSQTIVGAGAFTIEMLGHESWFVRAAAVDAVAAQRDLEAVPALIDVLEREDGRLVGDVLEVLRGMTGADYRDQPELWQRWWKTSEKKLRGILERLDGDDPVAYATAVDEAADLGFLLAAHRVLQDLKLVAGGKDEGIPQSKDSSGDGPKSDSPGGAGALGFESEDSQRDTACDAIGRTVRAAHLNVRDLAVRELVLEPLRKAKKAAPRRELLQILADAQCPESFQVLGDIAAGSRHLGSFDPPDREFALKALGDGRNSAAVPILAGLMDRPILVDHAPIVINLLEKIETRSAVGALVRLAVRLHEARRDDESPLARYDKSLIKQVFPALARLTSQELDEDADDWQEWWSEHGLRFQTAREKQAEESGEEIPSDDRGTTKTVFYGIQSTSKRLCFVLDVSGSMAWPSERDSYSGGGTTTKIDVAKKEILSTIDGLPEDAWFNIVFYSSGFKLWKPRLVQASPEVKKEAREWASAVHPGGATNIFDPLSKAFELAGRGAFDKGYEVSLDTIFFMSDGQPTTGLLQEPRRILEEIEATNRLKRVKIHTVGVGSGHDAAFMQELARLTGGVYIAR